MLILEEFLQLRDRKEVELLSPGFKKRIAAQRCIRISLDLMGRGSSFRVCRRGVSRTLYSLKAIQSRSMTRFLTRFPRTNSTTPLAWRGRSKRSLGMAKVFSPRQARTALQKMHHGMCPLPPSLTYEWQETSILRRDAEGENQQRLVV